MMESEALPNVTEFEEGELPNDDSEDLYIPLERPHIPFVADNIQQPPTESDDDNTIKDSSSDSDSSIKKNSKIRKKLVLKQTKNVTGKRKNYNIWSNDLQTDILTNCLVDCNVDQSNERVRSVESYNYKLGIPSKHIKSVDNNLRRDNLKNRRYTSKRKHNGAYITGKSHVNDSNENSETKTNVGNSRNILSLTTTIENSESEIATDIANKLFEEKEELILRALHILGKEAIISVFEETRKIEASGGMLIMNGTRRRTPGGLFFYLVKTSEVLPRDKIKEVFLEDKKTTARIKKLTSNEIKKTKAAKFKESLSKDDFPTLLSRTELAIKEFKAKRLAEETSEVINPPPSPATDGRDCSSDGDDPKGGDENGGNKYSTGRRLTTYDDSFFECEEDKMDSI